MWNKDDQDLIAIIKVKARAAIDAAVVAGRLAASREPELEKIIPVSRRRSYFSEQPADRVGYAAVSVRLDSETLHTLYHLNPFPWAFAPVVHIADVDGRPALIITVEADNHRTEEHIKVRHKMIAPLGGFRDQAYGLESISWQSELYIQ